MPNGTFTVNRCRTVDCIECSQHIRFNEGEWRICLKLKTKFSIRRCFARKRMHETLELRTEPKWQQKIPYTISCKWTMKNSTRATHLRRKHANTNTHRECSGVEKTLNTCDEHKPTIPTNVIPNFWRSGMSCDDSVVSRDRWISIFVENTQNQKFKIKFPAWELVLSPKKTYVRRGFDYIIVPMANQISNFRVELIKNCIG